MGSTLVPVKKQAVIGLPISAICVFLWLAIHAAGIMAGIIPPRDSIPSNRSGRTCLIVATRLRKGGRGEWSKCEMREWVNCAGIDKEDRNINDGTYLVARPTNKVWWWGWWLFLLPKIASSGLFAEIPVGVDMRTQRYDSGVSPNIKGHNYMRIIV